MVYHGLSNGFLSFFKSAIFFLVSLVFHKTARQDGEGVQESEEERLGIVKYSGTIMI